MRIAGDDLSMGRWVRVLVLMPALKTAGAAREALLVAYIAPGQGEMGRERRVYGTAIKVLAQEKQQREVERREGEMGEVDWIMQLRK